MFVLFDHQELKGEPDDAEGLYDEERVSEGSGLLVPDGAIGVGMEGHSTAMHVFTLPFYSSCFHGLVVRDVDNYCGLTVRPACVFLLGERPPCLCTCGIHSGCLTLVQCPPPLWLSATLCITLAP